MFFDAGILSNEDERCMFLWEMLDWAKNWKSLRYRERFNWKALFVMGGSTRVNYI